jgi:hypothetical protein
MQKPGACTSVGPQSRDNAAGSSSSIWLRPRLTQPCCSKRFNGTVRDQSDNDYGANYLEAEAIIAKLMQHYNEERFHATRGYMTPATWHRGQPEQIREQRAGQIAAARARRKAINQQRLTEAD